MFVIKLFVAKRYRIAASELCFITCKKFSKVRSLLTNQSAILERNNKFLLFSTT